MKVSDFFSPDNTEYVCSHDMFSYCRHGDKCRSKHIVKTRPIQNIIYHMKDPTKLINRRKLINTLNAVFKSKHDYYITTCIFKLQGYSCKNECQGRTKKITINYGGKDIEIQLCHGDIKRSRNRLMIALHIDIEYEIKKGRLTRESIIPYKSQLDYEEEKEKEANPDIADVFFPKLGKEDSKPVDDFYEEEPAPATWDITDFPKLEVKEKKIEPADMDYKVGPIVNFSDQYYDDDYEHQPYYRLREPVSYTDVERMTIMDKMQRIAVL
jgi:hypothetical protein